MRVKNFENQLLIQMNVVFPSVLVFAAELI